MNILDDMEVRKLSGNSGGELVLYKIVSAY